MDGRQRFFGFLFILAASLAAATLVPNGLKAGGPPQDVTFADTKTFPPVVFSHLGHIKQGLKCGGCHPKIFKMKQGSADEGNALTMASLNSGQFCGTCHNGEAAFSSKGDCKKCHNGS